MGVQRGFDFLVRCRTHVEAVPTIGSDDATYVQIVVDIDVCGSAESRTKIDRAFDLTYWSAPSRAQSSRYRARWISAGC